MLPAKPHTGASYGGGTHIQLGKSGNPVRNTGGTIVNAGNVGNLAIGEFNIEGVPTPTITNSLSLSSLAFRSGFSETPPYYGSTAGGVNKGITGDFAKLTAGRYIIFGANSLPFAYIAGTLGSNTALIGNAGQHPWRNAFAPFIRTTLYITKVANGGPPNGWDYTTGFRNAYGLGVGSSDQLNAEVNPGSYAIPGDILFLSTGKSLTTKVLPSKTD